MKSNSFRRRASLALTTSRDGGASRGPCQRQRAMCGQHPFPLLCPRYARRIAVAACGPAAHQPGGDRQKCVAGTPKPRDHRSHWQSRDQTNVLVAELLQVPQHQAFPELGRQRSQRPLQPRKVPPPRGLRRVGCVIGPGIAEPWRLGESRDAPGRESGSQAASPLEPPVRRVANVVTATRLPNPCPDSL